jgi:hypothetical protein
MRATEFIFSFIRRWNAGWCFCVAVLLGMFAVQGLAAVTVSHLRCENLLDPQGIDASRPRLSWVLDASGPNEKQTAYEIVVDGQWDSGRVESAQSIQVEYGGKGFRMEQTGHVQYHFEGVAGEMDRSRWRRKRALGGHTPVAGALSSPGV